MKDEDLTKPTDEIDLDLDAQLLKGLSDLYGVYTSYKGGLCGKLNDSQIMRIEIFVSTIFERLTDELYSSIVEK